MIEARWATLWVILVFGLGIAGLGTARLVATPQLPNLGSVPAAHPGWLAAGPSPSVPDTPVEPTRLRLPDQDVEAPVVAVGVEPNGELIVPDDPKVLGWWRDGVRPGSTRGTVVIDGHVDARGFGAGVLYHLSELKPGATVDLATTAGGQRYVVRAVLSYPKGELPKEIFDTTGLPRLVLISCGGEFNFQTHQYADNVVAYAVPLGA